MSVVSFQSLPILIDGYDPEGHLVLIDGQLAAVLARLDADANDPEFKGSLEGACLLALPIQDGPHALFPAMPLAQERGPRWRLWRSTGQAMFRSAATRRPSCSHQGTRRDGCLPLWPS